jgi:hypothetical protein
LFSEIGAPPELKVAAVAASVSYYYYDSPPSTPRARPQVDGWSTPPAAPREAPPPELLAAFREDSYEDVRRVLAKDPEAASMVFFDHDWEPPICAAVRLHCSADIVELTVKHGADIYAMDMRGRTPLTILSSSAKRCNETDKEICELLGIAHHPGQFMFSQPSARDTVIKNSLAVAEVFARAGADPSLPDKEGNYPCDLASACGNDHLVRFWGK